MIVYKPGGIGNSFKLSGEFFFKPQNSLKNKAYFKKPRHIMKDAAYFSYSGPQKFIIRTGRISQFWNLILPCLQANSKHVTVLSMHEHQYVGISSPCPSFM